MFVKKLGQTSIFDVIRYDNIEYFIANNIISSKYEVENIFESGITFITHACNDICMVKISTGKLRCRMPSYCHMASDNTKYIFMDTPLTVTQQ